MAKQKIAAAMQGHWQQLEVTKLRQECATIGEQAADRSLVRCELNVTALFDVVT